MYLIPIIYEIGSIIIPILQMRNTRLRGIKRLTQIVSHIGGT